MSDPPHDTIELFAGEQFSPIQDRILACVHRQVVVCAGRRVGKSWSGARKLSLWVVEDMLAEHALLEGGGRGRWLGETLDAPVAKSAAPDILYFVVAPREAHLNQIRSYLLEIFMRNGTMLHHPKFKGWFTDKGKFMWLWMDGICARIDFIPTTGEASMVSKGLHGVWLDEAGFIPNDRFLALKPALWERKGRLLASGTPSLGTSHWFTKLAISGLRDGDARYDKTEAIVDKNTRTFIADTVHHAFTADARNEALKDSKFWGEHWAAQWIYADWTVKVANIYHEFAERVHVAKFRTPQHSIGGHLPIIQDVWALVGDKVLPRAPDSTYGVVDWSGGTSPGAVTVCNVWKKNPLNTGDDRPLVVVREDYEGNNPYNSTPRGWWPILHMLDQQYQVDTWIGDPHDPYLIKQAKKAGIRMNAGPKQNKAGRISLVAGLLHYDREHSIEPALYITERCQHVVREMKNYRYVVNRYGESTDRPKDENDHTLDCLAMLVAEVWDTGGSVQIGNMTFS